MSDILKVVSGIVDLKKSGGNYIGLCPFHEEKTPSFVVNPEKNTYYCHGCNKHGGTIEFLESIGVEKADLDRFLIDYDFEVAYGSEIDNFNEKTFDLMKISFEMGWRMSRLNLQKDEN